MLRLIQRCAEFLPRTDYRQLPACRRGIYVLYRKQQTQSSKLRYNVLYVGMADSSMRRRLRSHVRNKPAWTHFSAYEVWPNITREEIRELEGLFRHIYRYDSQASALNLQRGFKAIQPLREQDLSRW